MVDADPRFRSLFTRLRSAKTQRERSRVARREMVRRAEVAESVEETEVVEEEDEPFVGDCQITVCLEDESQYRNMILAYPSLSLR